MSTTQTLVKTLATVAVGAVAGAATYLVMPAASAGVETTRAPSSVAVAAAGSKDGAEDGQECGPFGGWGSGEMPGWVQDRLKDLPRELRTDLRQAWKISDRAERRDALRAIWQAAKDGKYGAEVAELVKNGPFGGGGPGRGGWGPGHGGPGGGPWGSRSR